MPEPDKHRKQGGDGPSTGPAQPNKARPVLRKVDAVTIPVPDLDRGLAFYRDQLGHELLWRNDEIGQTGLGFPEPDTEIVLTIDLEYAPSC